MGIRATYSDFEIEGMSLIEEHELSWKTQVPCVFICAENTDNPRQRFVAVSYDKEPGKDDTWLIVPVDNELLFRALTGETAFFDALLSQKHFWLAEPDDEGKDIVTEKQMSEFPADTIPDSTARYSLSNEKDHEYAETLAKDIIFEKNLERNSMLEQKSGLQKELDDYEAEKAQKERQDYVGRYFRVSEELPKTLYNPSLKRIEAFKVLNAPLKIDKDSAQCLCLILKQSVFSKTKGRPVAVSNTQLPLWQPVKIQMCLDGDKRTFLDYCEEISESEFGRALKTYKKEIMGKAEKNDNGG